MALGALAPPRQRGKQQIEDEASLQAAIARIEQQYRVQGLFHLDYQQEVEERQVRRYRETPAHVQRKVRFHLTVRRNTAAITTLEFQLVWRIYATNAPQERLSLAGAVLAYRDQYIEENIFRRLQSKFLSITPLYLQRDDHAQGLFHFLTLGARLLALGDYLARQALAASQSTLTGIYSGNARQCPELVEGRGAARPTTERMLAAFEGIDLLILSPETHAPRSLTRLTVVQERILTLLGLSSPCSLTCRQTEPRPKRDLSPLPLSDW